MVKLEIIFKDVDYGELLYQYLPDFLEKAKQKDEKNRMVQILGNKVTLPGTVAKAALGVLPQDVKDDLLVKILNSYQKEILEKINTSFTENKITATVNQIRATKL